MHEKELSEEHDLSTHNGPAVAGESEIFVDPIIEKRALRKFDMVLLPMIVLMMLMAGLDSSNIGNAHVMGFDGK